MDNSFILLFVCMNDGYSIFPKHEIVKCAGRDMVKKSLNNNVTISKYFFNIGVAFCFGFGRRLPF